MKHFLIKFNHGVEIGARLAYLGHYRRTKTGKILSIATDELHHRVMLISMLKNLGEEPSWAIDMFFSIVGGLIGWACRFMPIWSLDRVARLMELFAIFSYDRLKLKYPLWKNSWDNAIKSEKGHEEYFRLGPERYKQLNDLRASLASGYGG